MTIGDTFLYGAKTQHLYVVVNKFSENENDYIIFIAVNFFSIKEGISYDTSCIVEPGEHRFISKRSFIKYDSAMKGQISPIFSKLIKKHDPVSEVLLKKIIEGGKKSPFLRGSFKKYFCDDDFK